MVLTTKKFLTPNFPIKNKKKFKKNRFGGLPKGKNMQDEIIKLEKTSGMWAELTCRMKVLFFVSPFALLIIKFKNMLTARKSGKQVTPGDNSYDNVGDIKERKNNKIDISDFADNQYRNSNHN